ncbi:MAG: type II toxin-antitoxin system mRNA interferase toxin, RelE/StbE family [Deltaproteobacteria bacterium]|nr:type II toxin-antitoxin system mRNA interferase toxin, RelE/StbE family [Deltaproteobacteria bacterium]
MYTVYEHKRVKLQIKKAPPDVKRKYMAWKRIMELEGQYGLSFIKGFHDEGLKGQWKGFRSSRLGLKWRVIYKIYKDDLEVYVIEINPHKY